jgi:hypothetical protein
MKAHTFSNPFYREAWDSVRMGRHAPRTAYRLSRINDALEAEIKRVESIRLEGLRKLAKKDDKGEPVIVENKFQFSDDVAEQVVQFMKDLMELELAVPADKIKLSELEAAGVILSEPQFAALRDLIEID